MSHYYNYTHDSGRDLLYDDDGYVRVYIVGCCLKNAMENPSAGFGVVFNLYHPWNYTGLVRGQATDYCGEIQGATYAINKAYSMDIKQLRLVTDSEFLITSATEWMHQWKENGWRNFDGRPLIVKEDLLDLDDALENAQSTNVKWEFVQAHSGDEYNELADKLAKEGAIEYRDANYNYF